MPCVWREILLGLGFRVGGIKCPVYGETLEGLGFSVGGIKCPVYGERHCWV